LFASQRFWLCSQPSEAHSPHLIRLVFPLAWSSPWGWLPGGYLTCWCWPDSSQCTSCWFPLRMGIKCHKCEITNSQISLRAIMRHEACLSTLFWSSRAELCELPWHLEDSKWPQRKPLISHLACVTQATSPQSMSYALSQTKDTYESFFLFSF
jgi:hypothetical protein